MAADLVFLDANVLFSAAYRADSRLRRLWRLGRVHLLTSGVAVEEARRNLVSDAQRNELDTLLVPITIVASSGSLDHLIFTMIVLPDKDRPILLAAIAGKATHLVTGDFQHFGPYYHQRIEGVLIVPLAAYLRTAGTGNHDQRNRNEG